MPAMEPDNAAIIGIEQARRRLGVFWLTATAATFLIMVARSLLRGFGDQIMDAWSWYLPTVFPTVGLMLSVFASDLEKGRDPRQRAVDVFYFRVAWWLSVFYVFNVVVILLVPADWELAIATNPIELMVLSNLWIGPLQGLTAAAIAWFFLTARAGGRRGSR